MKIPDCTHCLLFNDGPLLSVGACGLCDMDYRPICNDHDDRGIQYEKSENC